MLDEHQCCGFDSFLPTIELPVKGQNNRSIFSLGGHTKITTDVSLRCEAADGRETPPRGGYLQTRA